MPVTGVLPYDGAGEASSTQAGHRALLARLYEEELAAGPNEYLEQHSQPGWIDSHVRMFNWYLPYLQHASTVLDWGCQHGPDAVLLHAARPEVEVHGVDFCALGEYPTFRAASAMRYRQLDRSGDLPFEREHFDAVIAAGVLEHVASDWRSLAALHRVMRSGARLVVTFLPNRHSIEELAQRRRSGGHERLYGPAEVRRLLLHCGFRTITPVLYQTYGWNRQVHRRLPLGRPAELTAGLLQRLLPLHVVRAGTLCFVAERVDGLR